MRIRKSERPRATPSASYLVRRRLDAEKQEAREIIQQAIETGQGQGQGFRFNTSETWDQQERETVKRLLRQAACARGRVVKFGYVKDSIGIRRVLCFWLVQPE